MSAFFSQLASLVTAPPGNVIYHLVLVFSVVSALQSSYYHWRWSDYPQGRRALRGLGMLLLAQVLVFALGALAARGIAISPADLPPIDRAVTLFSILWITWLWTFPEPSRTADAAAWLASVLVAAALALSFLSWQPESDTATYNGTLGDRLWQVSSLLFGVLGLAMLAIRRPNGYWNGIVVLAIVLLGHAAHLLAAPTGNYPGIVRLAYISAFPVLLTLAQRFPVPAGPVRRPEAGGGEPRGRERRRYSTDQKTYESLMALATAVDPSRVNQGITRSIGRAMLADLCYLIRLTDDGNQFLIASGFDLIHEDNLAGGPLKGSAIPMLANAIQRGRPLRLPASSTSADIRGLADSLGLDSPGHVLCAPIRTSEGQQLGAIMLLSPYSDRNWTPEDQAYLANAASLLPPLLMRTQQPASQPQRGKSGRAGLAELERRNLELTRQLEVLQEQAQAGGSGTPDVASLMVALEELEAVVEGLRAENAQLLAAGSGDKSPASDPQLEQELRNALKENATLQNRLAESNVRVLELEKGQLTEKAVDQAEVIASISQELRQPMSSIVGYTDLLLGESVGILGALQRKFIERIKSSTERIGRLTEDMIQLTNLESGLVDLRPESVDLNVIIDNAMSYTSGQIREKNISMHIDLPKKLAPIKADREALQQILIHLLQNAGAATPPEGSITLAVQMRNEAGHDYVLVQVTDSGGGIPSADLPRVFTRLYRAENVLIQGVGDTGVGLSIAKTLTEAQRGRIWVESHPNVGSTFSVLLPCAGQDAGRALQFESQN
jgi:signal transduction histidine kinase